MCVGVCVFEWCGCRTRVMEGFNMCVGMSVQFLSACAYMNGVVSCENVCVCF